MSFNFSNFNKRLQELSSTVSQKTQEFSTNIPSLAQSTQRMVQERLGNVTDISQLPQEYLELEQKVDTLKLVFEHFLKVTAVYENESYDYPAYVRDSVNDFSKVVASKVQELSKASSASEAQNILVAPGPAKEPKTLNYALSKVAHTSSEHLNRVSDPQDAQLAAALMEYSDVQARIAQARLRQDTMIQTKFNKQLRDKLSESIGRANKHRKDVQYKRLQYDVARTNLQQAKPEKKASLRVTMETLEEEFAQATEEATVVMQEVLANANFLLDLRELVTAQLEYYQESANLLQEFLPVVEPSSNGNEAPAKIETNPTTEDA